MMLYINADELAFGELFARYKGRIYAYLLGRIRDRRAADDLLQSVFLNLHRSRITFKSERLFSAWIFTICRNVIRDHKRLEARVLSTQSGAESLDSIAVETSNEGSAEAQFEEVLHNVTPREREAIKLRYDKGMEFEEIARLVGISETNARQLISRAIRKIREALK